jgi:acetyl esterase/lipase
MLRTLFRRWKDRPRFERQSAWALQLAANGRSPRIHSRVLQIPSFFASWLVTEASFPWAALNLVRTARAVRRGDHRTPAGRAAVAAQVVAAGAAATFVVEARRTDEQFAAALAPYLTRDELDARPQSVRLGAWIPILYGGRKRRLRTRNIAFTTGDGPRISLDVYQPVEAMAPGAKRPALVQIHGGAWILGDKREQGIPLLNHMAANGWVGFNVNYRLAPRAKAPEQLIDCKRAIAWIRAHADEYGVDPDFICVTGGSAGGHLAALCALTPNVPAFQPGFEEADTRLQGAVPFYGAYDMADTSLMIKGYRELFLEPYLFGSKFAAGADPFEQYSPIHHVRPDAPPMMMVHGTRDALIPIEAARPFAAKLGEVSEHAVVWVELDGAQHAFDVFPSPRCVRTIEYTERFLDAVHRGVIK